ncbi:hypothetical protein [Paenibacillus dakarensis]|uniref:hypothetical protein n=1 Tax=Paenibacillus dakarensis TaxID=1527293 RepID=UPI000A4751E9|nr:hypothetical protein [Paenibacillus dakarensis]
MDNKLRRYHHLKQKQKEIEQELTELRSEIIDHCRNNEVTELEQGGYRAKLVLQERKEFDDKKLYEALPDPVVWQMLSKADSTKISSLVTLGVISAEKIKDTYSIKQVTLLQVDKK